MLANRRRIIRTSIIGGDPRRAVIRAADCPVGAVNDPYAAGLSHIWQTKCRATIGCTSIAVVVVPIVASLDTHLHMPITATGSAATGQTCI
jgi:hypothetical protein